MVAVGADRARGVLDGHLPGKLHAADAQRRRAAAGSDGARRSCWRLAAHPRAPETAGAPRVARRGKTLMGRFEALAPELLLSIGGAILMMVAAFTGRRGSGLVSWLAVALLLAATALLPGAPSHAGPVF